MKKSAASKIGIAIVGYGYWGPNLVRNFLENSNCKVICVCDRDEKRLTQAKRRYPSMQMTASWDSVLSNPEVDAIVIATPVSTHAALCEEALQNGKHVLVEKPLAASLRDAKRIVTLARTKRRVLMVGHTFLYSPPVLKVKELLSKKALGKIHTIDFSRVNLGLFQPDVNVIWDLAPHDISIALHWLGRDPINVRASAKSFVRKQIEEVGYLALEFPGNIWVHHHLSWLAPVKLRRVTIVGSEKMLVYDDTHTSEKVKIYDWGVLKNPSTYGEFQLTYRSGSVISPSVEPTEPLSLECADFIHAVRDGVRPISDGAFGARVVRILEAAQRSLKKHGAAIKLS